MCLLSLCSNWTLEEIDTLITSESCEEAAKKLSSVEGKERTITPHEIEQMYAHPLVDYARRVSRAHRKMAGLLETLAELNRLSKPPEMVYERLCPEDFFQQYYSLNRPVLFKGIVSDSPAALKWSLEFFEREYGDEEAEVTLGRGSNNITYELAPEKFQARIPIKDFISRIREQAPTNDLYLTAGNHFLENPAFSALLEDLPKDLGFFIPDTSHPNLFDLWIGPAGTTTHLHHDVDNVLLAQFYGSKKAYLIPAIELPKVSNTIGVFSSLNLSDQSALPSLRETCKTDVYEFTLEPGDALFIPVGWWHYVEALTNSISITFHNLVPANKEIEWKDNFWLHGPAHWNASRGPEYNWNKSRRPEYQEPQEEGA
jgi:hypothetical protein